MVTVCLTGSIPWRGVVYLNTGGGFDSAWIPWEAAEIKSDWRDCPSGGCANGDAANIVSELVDVNGDGLPDYVTGWGQWGDWVLVMLNTGSGFTDSFTVPLGDPDPNDDHNYLGLIHNYWEGGSFTVSMFADANGDGIADRFMSEACLRIPTQIFALGNGWQSWYGTGQQTYDVSVPDDLTAVWAFCEDFGSEYKSLMPEFRIGGFKTAALLDLNGDGINDYFHRRHPARTGDVGPSVEPSVWFGLGDGSYLTLDDHSHFPSETNIPPGINWSMPWGEGASGQSAGGQFNSFSLVETMDMNGDGLLDRVYFGNNSWFDTDTGGDYYAVIFHPGPTHPPHER